ncbi:MAG TPA: hypothetical protein DEQ30_02735, partial [Porphyromonadaceae bacterium]|nr:hypothetical protein [Porphyromonadaceae bacterium]
NEIETPFIAHVNNDFVMVYKTESSNVKYLWKGKKINASMDEFIKNWTGVLLLAEATE